jgi:ABC-type spermidine/putrescine transport system permease subunit II
MTVTTAEHAFVLGRRRRVSAAIGRYVIRPAGVVFKALIVFFMLGPIVTVAVLSFGENRIFSFPPPKWGFGLYSKFLHSHYWVHSILTSMKIAIAAAALATVVTVPVAWSLRRTRMPLKGAFLGLGIAPLLLPAVSFAIALYVIYLRNNLLDTTLGVILAHSVLAVPFVLLIVTAAVDRIPAELELVAMSLGASRFRAVRDVTLRLLKPALAAALLFGFVTSFDESTFVQFLAGPNQTTLPKAIFDSVRTGLEPLIMAVAALLVTVSVGLILIIGWLRGARAGAVGST